MKPQNKTKFSPTSFVDANRNLKKFCNLVALIVAGLSVGGCAHQGVWSEFHGDKANTGYLQIHSSDPVEIWDTQIGPENAAYTSPVIAPDGTIYVGNGAGELVALSHNGQIKWHKHQGSENSVIGSAPAVGADGFIYVFSTECSSKGFTTLCKVDPNDGSEVWELKLGNGGWGDNRTFASPRTWGGDKGNPLFILYYLPPNLFVVNQDGKIVTVHQICEGYDLQGGNSFNWFTLDPVVLPPIYPYLESTVAIVDKQADAASSNPLIIVSEGNCGVFAYKWDTDTMTFTKKWEQGFRGQECSSPVVTDIHSVIVGRSDGTVTSYDLSNGAENWHFKADAEVVSTPSVLGGRTYAISDDKIYLLDSGGQLINKTRLTSDTRSSPAIDLDHVYVSTRDSLCALNSDITSPYFHDPAGAHSMASPALAKDGTLYILTQNGSLRAYNVGSLSK